MTFEIDPGSYRDPSGFVFRLDGAVYRALDAAAGNRFQQLEADGTLAEIAGAGLIIDSQFVPEGSSLWGRLHAEVPTHRHFLRHETVEIITYPYEWSTAMLADAALCTLALQERLVRRGYSLKDATPYNVQFIGAHPVFIDIASIEAATRRDIWPALGQFYRLFLYPLLLKQHHDYGLRGYFRANLDGFDLDRVAGMLGLRRAFAPAMLLDVGLPYLLKRLAVRLDAGASARSMLKKKLHVPAQNMKPQLLNLQRLANKVKSIPKKCRCSSTWTDYACNNTYSEWAETRKTQFIERFLEETRPKYVLDLGANTGKYSELAARHGATVMAVDSDHDCVETLYRRLLGTDAAILPIWMDITDPSPGLGFRNRERRAFLDRAPRGSVFALALLHHLLVTSRISVVAVRDFLCDLAEDYLILEYVDVSDQMFQRLIALRTVSYENLTLEQLLRVFQERFVLLRQEALPDVQRTLLLFRKR